MRNLSFLLLALLFVTAGNKTIPFVTKTQELNHLALTPITLRNDKVDVCHKGKIINISSNAVPAHLAHGDALDMDGDGYFDIDNACGATDCDDANNAINECPACSINAIDVLNATCTDPDPTYDLQLRITFENAPAAGALIVTVDNTEYPFAIGASPQIVNVFGLPPTGIGVNVAAHFSNDTDCELVANDLYVAPDCGL